MTDTYPQYISTRHRTPAVSFEDALLRGLAPDGGLYIPDRIPRRPALYPNAPVDFAALAQSVLAGWLAGEVPDAVRRPLIDDAFDFPVPLVPLDGGGWAGVSVLELFHGPTLSFKDFGARMMARLMGHFVAQRGRRLTILVATSGDTGSAVADGFAGRADLQVVLLYPKGQVSPTQERQLIVRRPGVRTFAVAGTFDDCQRMVKAAFVDDGCRRFNLSSANSINIGRLLPQMLYYHWAVRQSGGGEVVFCVPSGNLGNVTGGVLAALSGLPVGRFVAAHNANAFFPHHLAGRTATAQDSVRTLSNAMDVGVPSNFERLQALLPGAALRRKMWGTSVDDHHTVAALRAVLDATGYLADPHTAVGLEGLRRYRDATGDRRPAVVLATAHPAKFGEVIEAAVGQAPPVPHRLSALWDEAVAVQALPPTLDALRAALGDAAEAEGEGPA